MSTEKLEIIHLENELLKTRRLLQTIKNLIEKGELDRDKIMSLLTKNHNIIDPDSARYLLDKKVISRDDMNACGIDQNYIDLLYEGEPDDPANEDEFHPIENIAPNATEVYFWGMPASGKSCALGSILSMARNSPINDIMEMQPCQGYVYMDKLSTVFKHDGIYNYLPAGTRIKNTYEMRFLLTRQEKEHPLALIDLSGELFQCLYKNQCQMALEQDEREAYEVLNNILVEHASQNHKIHFFVIEYGAENKKINGLTQDSYLQRAAEYMDAMNVFKHYTDAIYIILTKADKAGTFTSFQDEQDFYKNYMVNNYLGFYKALRKMCKANNINGGKLEFIPFSIGEVVLRRMCHFNGSSALEILDYIVERSAYVERNRLGKIIRLLRQ